MILNTRVYIRHFKTFFEKNIKGEYTMDNLDFNKMVKFSGIYNLVVGIYFLIAPIFTMGAAIDDAFSGGASSGGVDMFARLLAVVSILTGVYLIRKDGEGILGMASKILILVGGGLIIIFSSLLGFVGGVCIIVGAAMLMSKFKLLK